MMASAHGTTWQERVFNDRLKLTLTLKIGESEQVFPAGAVKRFGVELTRLGFRAEASLLISSELAPDPLVAAFVTSTLIEAVLELEPVEPAPDASTRDSLLLRGIVTDKSLVETTGPGVEGEPVVLRLYRVQFCDPAAAFWRRHYPCELHTKAKLKTVLDAHRCGGLKLTYEWPWLDEERELIAFDLGSGPGQASFYDLLVWWLDRYGGVLEFDSRAGGYRLGGRKSTPASPSKLLALDVARIDIAVPVPNRATFHLLNASASSATNEKLEAKHAVTGVRNDRLHHSPVPARLQAEKDLLPGRFRAAEPRLCVVFAQYPRTTHLPNRGVVLDDDLSRNLFAAGKPQRVVKLTIHGQEPTSADDAAELEDETAVYQLECRSELEPQGDPTRELPPYEPPRFPFHVQGKVVSEGGKQADRTWSVIEDSKTSLLTCRVDVPLFNKKVLAPYQAGNLPGQFFFPAYKNQRVLLAVHFDHVSIERFLDWASEAKLPQDKQGQAIAFGKSATDGTLLSHGYSDGKPVLTLKRTFDSDEQFLKIADGTVTLDVRQTSLAPVLEPTYDVTPNVAAAQSKLETQVKGSIADVSTTFSGASSKVADTLTNAIAHTEEKLAAVETELTVRAATIRAEVEGLVSALSESVGEIATAISEAKSAIMQVALE